MGFLSIALSVFFGRSVFHPALFGAFFLPLWSTGRPPRTPRAAAKISSALTAGAGAGSTREVNPLRPGQVSFQHPFSSDIGIRALRRKTGSEIRTRGQNIFQI